MKSLTIKNLSKSFHGNTLFANVSFSVHKGDKIAVTGKNGAGKSTLLKIISGVETSDTGKVLHENVSYRYVPQEFSGNQQLSILEYLDVTAAPVRVFDILKQFSVITEHEIEHGYVYELSGGQQRLLEIAMSLSHAPMFLCLDEPENHLDIKARSVLSTMLQHYWGGVVFVSHDRSLINAVSNKILSIEDGTAHVVTGKTYEEYVALKHQHMLGALNSWKAEAKAVKKLEDNVRMLKARTRYNDAQAKTYQMKKRELQKRREQLGTRPDREKGVRIAPTAVKQKSGKLIFGCHNMHFAYPGQPPLLKNVNVELRFGERVVLLGRNGSGKTTFLNLLQGTLQPTVGEVRRGNDIKTQYINQSTTLDENKSPLEHLYAHRYTEEQARSLLAQFLFTQSEAESALSNLSGGQRQRFTFLFLFTIAPECLVLDEPTNNLDPETWELLLQLINDYTGSLLLISHDQRFIESIQNKQLWVLKDGTLKESWDNITTVLEKL